MRLCKKIGKYYITRNNPRELLLQIKELKDKVNILEHPAEQLIRIKGFQKEFDDTVNKLEASEKARKEAIKYIRTELLCFDNESVEYIEGLKILNILDIDKGE